MIVTDILISMLVDVLKPNDMFYFSLSTLKLSHETLKVCMVKGENYTTLVFKLFSDAIWENRFSITELQTKFKRYEKEKIDQLFNIHEGKFE